MIPPGGTFDYSVFIERDTASQDRWFGEGRSRRGLLIHPGMFGKRPKFELKDGRISLHATESKLSILTNPHFRRHRPAAPDSFEVGGAPAEVIHQGDQLSFHRFGTGDFALTIMRNESLILAIGSSVRLPLGKEIHVEEDVRISEMELYYLAEDLDRIDDPESQVIWIDVGKGDLEAQLELIERAPRCEHLIIAIKRIPAEGGERIVPLNFYDRLMDKGNAESISCFEVDVRFPDKQSWIGYINQLPRGRPKDLHLSFMTGHEQINLCEGEEAFIGAYYVRVDRVYRMGIPGELSSFAIARMFDGLTKDMVIESARLILKC